MVVPTRALQAARPLPASPRELPSLLASYVDGSSGKRAGPSGTIRSGNTTSPMARLQGEKGARQRRLRIAPCGVAAEGGALSARHRVRRRACWSSPTISRRVVHNRARASSASRLSRARRTRVRGARGADRVSDDQQRNRPGRVTLSRANRDVAPLCSFECFGTPAERARAAAALGSSRDGAARRWGQARSPRPFTRRR